MWISGRLSSFGTQNTAQCRSLFWASSCQVRLDRTCASGFPVSPPACLDSPDFLGARGSAGFCTAVRRAVGEPHEGDSVLWEQPSQSLETWSRLRLLSDGSYWTKSPEICFWSYPGQSSVKCGKHNENWNCAPLIIAIYVNGNANWFYNFLQVLI